MSGRLNTIVSEHSLLTDFGFPEIPIVVPSNICSSARRNRLPANDEEALPLRLRQAVRSASSVGRPGVFGERESVAETQGPTQQLITLKHEGDRKRSSNVAG